MCRLAFVPPKSPISRGELSDLFDYLERQCGGDGTGYLLIPKDEDKPTRMVKGVKLSTKMVVKDVYRPIRGGHGLIYHTRKVSVGWLSDDQCHPHVVGGRKARGYLVHNGTWYDGVAIANYLGCGSDTAALARVLGKFGMEGAEDRGLFPKSGVFLLHLNGELRAIKKGGDLRYCPRTGIFASSFPLWWGGGDYEVATGSHSLLSPPPEEVKLPAPQTGYKKLWYKASALLGD